MADDDPASASDPSGGPPLRPSLVFLIGYRGTGKSIVGRRVAQALGWRALDMDETIEASQGRTIRQIFEAEGEAAFRRLEAALLREISGGTQQVIATGGGIVLDVGNRRLLRASGHVVWLTADARCLWQRIQADPGSGQRRPDLSVGGLAEVEELLRVREPLYRECAACTVATEGRSPEDVAAAVLATLNPG
jgi:shikimate kinase